MGLEKRGCDRLEVDDWAWERTGEQAWEKCDIQIQEVSSDEDDDGVVKPKKGAGLWGWAAACFETSRKKVGICGWFRLMFTRSLGA